MVRINTIIVQICHVCNGHSINCVHFACREANNVNNDLALLVRGYVVRWLEYYCTFRMTHTCTVRHIYKNMHSHLLSSIVEGDSQQNGTLNTMMQAIQSKYYFIFFDLPHHDQVRLCARLVLVQSQRCFKQYYF